jgi:hypothetical protein
VPRPTPTFVILPPPAPRRLVLGLAFLLALFFAVVPRPPAVYAQEPKPAAPAAPAATPAAKAPAGASATITGSDGKGKTATINIKTDDRSVTIDATVPKDEPAAKAESGTDDVIIGVGPRKSGKKGVRVGTFGDNREYDSFEAFVHNEPAIAGMIIAIVSIVFLTPVLAIALILWYRMRKTRMLNETMLKLAEKGVVPPAEAIGALAGNPSSVAAAVPATAPLYEQAKQIRRRAAWSDLRKGVIMGGVGLGFTLFSLLDDRSANFVGLVLLFLGIGYIVLWWFEERQLGPRPSDAGAAASAPPSGGTGAGA